MTWLWGGFSVDNPTLNRFFSLHYLLPFVIFGVVFLHVAALHITGSNNPLGIDPKGPQDTLPFHPYYTAKDSVGMVAYFVVFAVLVFFFPNYLGHPDNYIPANPLVTPAHIVPEWYFLPFYAILRAVPDKLGGVVLMFGSIAILFVLPWLDTSPGAVDAVPPAGPALPVRLAWSRSSCCSTAAASRPEEPYVTISRVATAYYFLYFLVILPLLGRLERPLPLPESIARPVLRGGGPLPGRRHEQADGEGLMRRCSQPEGPARSRPAWSPAPARRRPGRPARRCHLPETRFSFDGLFGHFDRASAQRGFQVYKEVCANCHVDAPAVLPQPARARPVGSRGGRPSPRPSRCRTGRTTRARCSSGRAVPPTASAAPSPTRRRRARPTTAPARPTCR